MSTQESYAAIFIKKVTELSMFDKATSVKFIERITKTSELDPVNKKQEKIKLMKALDESLAKARKNNLNADYEENIEINIKGENDKNIGSLNISTTISNSGNKSQIINNKNINGSSISVDSKNITIDLEKTGLKGNKIEISRMLRKNFMKVEQKSQSKGAKKIVISDNKINILD